MDIVKGKGETLYGKGISILLTGDEVAMAIRDWIKNKATHISGPSTVLIESKLCTGAEVYVDPSGYVEDFTGKRYSGVTGEVVLEVEPDIDESEYVTIKVKAGSYIIPPKD